MRTDQVSEPSLLLNHTTRKVQKLSAEYDCFSRKMPKQIIFQHAVSMDRTHGFGFLSCFPQAVTLPLPNCSQILHETIPPIGESNISADHLDNIKTLDCGQLWKVE
jgi:hypothetical protein